MDVFVWAQIIGFIGYLFLIYAPHLPTKQKIMQFELLACCILTFQWFLLGQPVLMFSNMIGIVSLAVALSRLDPRCKNFLFLALYPLSLLFMAYIWQGTLLDVLTIIALIGSISARRTAQMGVFRAHCVIIGCALSICGFLTMSIPAMLFNLLFVAGHVQKSMEPMLQRRLPPSIVA